MCIRDRAMVQWVTIRDLTTSMVTTIAMVDLTRDTLLKEEEMRVCETGICLSEERATTTMTDLNLALKVLQSSSNSPYRGI